MNLSNKQREALELAANGHSTESGALEMGVSCQMYCRHLKLARDKLKSINTTNAVYNACKKGLICFMILSMKLAEVAIYFDDRVHIDFSRMTRRTKTRRDSDAVTLQHIAAQGRNIVLQS